MEEIMRAIGAALEEHGYTVVATRDFPEAPFILDIGKPLVYKFQPGEPGSRKLKTLVLAEMEDEPGYLEVCSEHEDLHNLHTIDLNNPGSIDEILAILADYLVDDFPESGTGDGIGTGQVP